MTSNRRQRRLAGLLAVALAIGAAHVAGVRPGPATALSLVAVPDTLTVTHDHTTSVPAPGVLKNDITVLGTTAVLNTQPSHGSVVLHPNGSYTYDPDPLYVGTDVFKYHDFDGLLPTNTTTVTITVMNRAPSAADDRESANAGRKESVGAPGVLENDDDPDGDDLQAQLVAGPSHGALTLRSDGSFDYTAEPGFDGDDVFTYVATDGIDASDPARVVMNVSASGSTPGPSSPPPPTPTPVPTPVPTPTPTPVPTLPLPPLPTLTLPPLPLPSLFATPRPTPSPSPGPGQTAAPSPSPSPSPAPGATDDPTRPAPSSSPAVGGVVPPGPGSGGSGGGPGSSGSGGSGSGGGATGGSSAGGSTGGPGGDADGPLFSVGGDGPDPVVPLANAEFAGFDGIDWAVPALTLSVPGLLLMLAVLAQLTASAVWLPMIRRWLGAFGLGRRRRRAEPAA